MKNSKIKSWIIETRSPFYDTEQYYGAFSEEDPTETKEIQDWFWNEETKNLWDMYSYLEHYEEDFEGEEEDFDDYMDTMFQEWQEDCSIRAFECPEEDFTDYTPNACEIEIIYDERTNNQIN